MFRKWLLLLLWCPYTAGTEGGSEFLVLQQLVQSCRISQRSRISHYCLNHLGTEYAQRNTRHAGCNGTFRTPLRRDVPQRACRTNRTGPGRRASTAMYRDDVGDALDGNTNHKLYNA